MGVRLGYEAFGAKGLYGAVNGTKGSFIHGSQTVWLPDGDDLVFEEKPARVSSKSLEMKSDKHGIGPGTEGGNIFFSLDGHGPFPPSHIFRTGVLRTSAAARIRRDCSGEGSKLFKIPLFQASANARTNSIEPFKVLEICNLMWDIEQSNQSLHNRTSGMQRGGMEDLSIDILEFVVTGRRLMVPFIKISTEDGVWRGLDALAKVAGALGRHLPGSPCRPPRARPGGKLAMDSASRGTRPLGPF